MSKPPCNRSKWLGRAAMNSDTFGEMRACLLIVCEPISDADGAVRIGSDDSESVGGAAKKEVVHSFLIRRRSGMSASRRFYGIAIRKIGFP